MWKGYIVISSYAGEIGKYEVDTSKPIAEELIRTIQQEQIVLEEGDKIEFKSE